MFRTILLTTAVLSLAACTTETEVADVEAHADAAAKQMEAGVDKAGHAMERGMEKAGEGMKEMGRDIRQVTYGSRADLSKELETTTSKMDNWFDRREADMKKSGDKMAKAGEDAWQEMKRDLDALERDTEQLGETAEAEWDKASADIQRRAAGLEARIEKMDPEWDSSAG